jgi:hypothetical protein
MTDVLHNIYTFNTARFRLEVDALIEHDPDMSWDETGQTQRDIDNYDAVIFCARARITHIETGTVLGEDYLGDCIYSNYDDFKQPHGYFGDMVANVIRDSREMLPISITA